MATSGHRAEGGAASTRLYARFLPGVPLRTSLGTCRVGHNTGLLVSGAPRGVGFSNPGVLVS